MARVFEHLRLEELEARYVRCQDATASRHCQVIWLLAGGHTVPQVSATTAYGARWIEQLLARYNAEGPEALGDLRRRNGTSATILKPELPAKLRDRLREPPADGGLWSSHKVADGIAAELGLKSVAPQRGWRAESRVAGQSAAFRASGLSGAAKARPILGRIAPEGDQAIRERADARQALKAIGWSIQKPRPKNPKSASPEEAAAFKKSSRTPLPKRPHSTPASRSRCLPRTSTASA
ncbi:MAG: helix-turn-helix domain-containing protein [Methylocella sp.]